MAKTYSKNNTQIAKFSGKDSFFEVMNTGFEIGKVLVNFVKYDDKGDKGNKVLHSIPIYLDFDKALFYAQDILSGRISAFVKADKDKMAEAKKNGKSFYPKEIKDYTHMGGTSAERLKQQNKERPDGKSESRQLKFIPSSLYEIMLVAEQGAGEETDKGLISQKKVESKVQVPLTAEDMKKFALVLRAHIEAYLTSTYVSGKAFDTGYKPEQNK